jgi:tRNA 2-thiouridine synthesizing protein A
VTAKDSDDNEPSGRPGSPARPPEHEIDSRGRRCPLPILDLARAFVAGDVAVGDIVAVAAEDPAAAYDIPAWCRMRAQEYVGRRTAPDGAPVYLVRRIS